MILSFSKFFFWFCLEDYVRESGHAYSAPFWLGETGTNSDDDKWNKIYDHLKDFDLDWAYWSVDGYKYRRTSSSSGITLETA